VGIERKPNKSEKKVRAIPTAPRMPRMMRSGLMPKLGDGGPEERTICMRKLDYTNADAAAASFSPQ
jgi:hypothetical protein